MSVYRLNLRRPFGSPHCLGLVWLTWLLVASAVSTFAQQQRTNGQTTARWEVLDGCLLAPGTAIDGDSFHVLHKNREYIFRLYFVDAPESDALLAERIEDQAAYFGVATKDVPAGAKLATEFTRTKLSSQSFTIVTRWQNALGRSQLARFYAVVLIGSENLADQLVRVGLARIYGPRANWPDAPRSTTFVKHLKNTELVAREKQLGMWNERSFVRRERPGSASEPQTRADPQEALIDLNKATQAELERLPGVGKVTAERIIAHRPYRKIEDLDLVPGIGAKTMEKLRPLVKVTSPRL